MPAALIQVLSSPGAVVLDPFCGSGTTAVEATRLGRRALASDLSSTALMVTAAKISMLEGHFDRRRRGEILARLAFPHECRSEKVGVHGEGSNPALREWYTTDTLSQLRFLYAMAEEQPPPVRRVLNAVFSEVLYLCASTGGSLTRSGKTRRHHWGWIADNVRPKVPINHDAIAIFADKVAALADQAPGAGEVQLLRQDARALALRDSSVDLIVTSPPYLGVIDYTHAHRLLYLWMGWSIAQERESEIGARYRRARRSALSEYLTEMERVSDEFRRVLKVGGRCAVVLGSSRRFAGADREAMSLFASRLTPIWGPRPRMATRRRVSDRAASETVEYIYVLERR